MCGACAGYVAFGDVTDRDVRSADLNIVLSFGSGIYWDLPGVVLCSGSMTQLRAMVAELLLLFSPMQDHCDRGREIVSIHAAILT